MVTFSDLIEELISNVENNRDVFIALSKNPNLLFKKLTELVSFTGSRHKVTLQLHFPDSKKITDIDSYGTENISVVIDKFQKKFSIPKEDIKRKTVDLLGTDIEIQDAYMYEGKEGLRVIRENGRIEVLPGSVHLWCILDKSVKSYVDWLMKIVYNPEANGPT
jgi:hypothetical protein